MRESYFPIVIFTFIVLGLGIFFMLAAQLFGPRRKSRQKYEPYECGVDLLDPGGKKFHVKFYLIATLFILFDIETVFLVPWAVAFQANNYTVIIEMFIFLLVLAIGLVYILKKKVFEWE